MRYLWILFIPLLLGATPLYNEHETQQKVDEELRNIYLQMQPLNLRVFSSTPNLNDVQDGEIVKISSNSPRGNFSRLVYRDNLEIYGISISCITIRR